MPTTTTAKILIRNARDQDIPAVTEIDAEAFSASAEQPETFQQRLRAFPDGFIILIADNEIAAYGCSEKWLTEHEPAPDGNALQTHQPDGEYSISATWLSERKTGEKAMACLFWISFLKLPTEKAAGKLSSRRRMRRRCFKNETSRPVKAARRMEPPWM